MLVGFSLFLKTSFIWETDLCLIPYLYLYLYIYIYIYCFCLCWIELCITVFKNWRSFAYYRISNLKGVFSVLTFTILDTPRDAQVVAVSKASEENTEPCETGCFKNCTVRVPYTYRKRSLYYYLAVCLRLSVIEFLLYRRKSNLVCMYGTSVEIVKNINEPSLTPSCVLTHNIQIWLLKFYWKLIKFPLAPVSCWTSTIFTE